MFVVCKTSLNWGYRAFCKWIKRLSLAKPDGCSPTRSKYASSCLYIAFSYLNRLLVCGILLEKLALALNSLVPLVDLPFKQCHISCKWPFGHDCHQSRAGMPSKHRTFFCAKPVPSYGRIFFESRVVAGTRFQHPPLQFLPIIESRCLLIVEFALLRAGDDTNTLLSRNSLKE